MSDDINRNFKPRCGCEFHDIKHGVVAAILVRNSGVVPIDSSRDVSDPRTDPGVRVRGPRVGSLTPRLLSDGGHPRGEGRRAINRQRRT